MSLDRLRSRRGDGSAVVRGWVWFYTLGLPGEMRARRRGEVAGDLADETVDAVRRRTTAGLRRRRLVRLVFGIPDDILWRLTDARAMAGDARSTPLFIHGPRPWVPVSRWTLIPLAIIAIGAAGGLMIVGGPELAGQGHGSDWAGWGRYGFVVGCVGVLIAVPVSVPWPRRGLTLVVPSVIVGVAASPWLAACWLLSLVAVAFRADQARFGWSSPLDRGRSGTPGVAGGAR